jgi:hypothetical protein
MSTRRAVCCAALSGGAWSAQGCMAEVESDGRIGQVQQALDVVDNPGTFDFLLTDDSIFVFKSAGSPAVLLGHPSGGSYFTADVDANGDVSAFSSQFLNQTHGAGCPGNVTASVELRSTSTGSLVPYNTITFDGLEARVKFNNGGTCNTAWFSLASTGYLNDTCTGVDFGDNEFCVGATGFAVPQLASSACNNNGNCINFYYDLSGTGTTFYLHGETSPEIEGGAG